MLLCHELCIGLWITAKDLVILLKVQHQASSPIIQRFLDNLLIISQFYDPNSWVSLSKAKAAAKFIEKNLWQCKLRFVTLCEEFFVALGKNTLFISGQVARKGINLPPEQQLNFSQGASSSSTLEDFTSPEIKVLDLARAYFVVSEEMLAPFNGNLVKFCKHLQLIGNKYIDFGNSIPRIFGHVFDSKLWHLIMATLDRMSKPDVLSWSAPVLTLSTRMLRISESTNLAKLFFKKLKQLQLDIKNSKRSQP